MNRAPPPPTEPSPVSIDRARDPSELEGLAAIGEIAAEMAHELRNTLLVISASAYLARQNPAESAPHIAKIERHAKLAQSVVDDVMALARGDAHHAEPTRLSELMQFARNDFPVDAANFDDVVDPSLRALVHPGLAARLLHTLYENAIAIAQPRAPRITTTARVDAGDAARLVIDVHDDGPGVPSAIADRIFEPLVTARPGGSGLGLALARRIAVAHRGEIVLLPADAAHPGATFRITLRRAM